MAKRVAVEGRPVRKEVFDARAGFAGGDPEGSRSSSNSSRADMPPTSTRQLRKDESSRIVKQDTTLLPVTRRSPSATLGAFNPRLCRMSAPNLTISRVVKHAQHVVNDYFCQILTREGRGMFLYKRFLAELICLQPERAAFATVEGG